MYEVPKASPRPQRSCLTCKSASGTLKGRMNTKENHHHLKNFDAKYEEKNPDPRSPGADPKPAMDNGAPLKNMTDPGLCAPTEVVGSSESGDKTPDAGRGHGLTGSLSVKKNFGVTAETADANESVPESVKKNVVKNIT